jgi:DNA-binding transcriptional MerR regulator
VWVDGIFQIGDVARRCRVSPDTVRHYERLGLIPAAARSKAGYRQYPASTCRRVLVVRSALRLGFSLKELVALLAVRDRGGAPCHEVRRLAQAHMAGLQQEIRELLGRRRRLRTLLKEWDTRLAEVAPGAPAHLLEALVQEA